MENIYLFLKLLQSTRTMSIFIYTLEITLTRVFFQVNDSVIKDADIYDIYEDNVFLMMYYIFDNEIKEEVENSAIEQSIHLTEEIKEILLQIEINEEKTTKGKKDLADLRYERMFIKRKVREFPKIKEEIDDETMPYVRYYTTLMPK